MRDNQHTALTRESASLSRPSSWRSGCVEVVSVPPVHAAQVTHIGLQRFGIGCEISGGVRRRGSGRRWRRFGTARTGGALPALWRVAHVGMFDEKGSVFLGGLSTLRHQKSNSGSRGTATTTATSSEQRRESASFDDQRRRGVFH